MEKQTEIAEDLLLEEILMGLSGIQKRIPSKYFYDEEGSKLFDQICELDEYYPTRTEQKIMQDNIDAICENLNNDTLFIEFGSGSSTKTKLILSHVHGLAAYVPIDISEEHLNGTAESLNKLYPNIDIFPLAADYTQQVILPNNLNEVENKVAYFPGSTIGNFTPTEAKIFLASVAELVGKNGALLLGIDLIKEVDVLDAAYNDKKGITAAFNLNILTRLNNEYEADINLENFEHDAFYNIQHSRIEMHLVSKVDQHFFVAGSKFLIKKDETILTEYSYKYSLGGIAYLAREYFNVAEIWTDELNYFGVLLLRAN